MNAKNIFRTVVHVLKQPAYTGLTLCIAIFMIILNTYLLNWSLIRSTISEQWTIAAKAGLLLKLLGGVITNNTALSLTLLLTTSVLAGTNVALAVYQWKKHRTLSIAQQSVSTTGVGAGFLAAGCSSCGISVLAALGMAGILTALPLQGVEISLLSIIILVGTLIWIAQSDAKPACSNGRKSLAGPSRNTAMNVLKCPSCKRAAITPYMGAQFGKYQCKKCGYIGVLVIEEEIPKKILRMKRHKQKRTHKRRSKSF